MKECTYLTCNRPSDSWENAEKKGARKHGEGRGQGERAKDPLTLSLLLSSTFVFLRSPFRDTVPLGTGQFIVGQKVFSSADASDLAIDVHLGVFDILKARTHAATIPALACVKRHFFFYFPFCCRGKFLAICV